MAKHPRRTHGTYVVATRLFAPEPTPAASRNEALVRAMERAGHRVRVMTTRAPEAEGHRDTVRDVSRWPVKRDRQGHVKGYVSYLSYDIPLIARLLLQRDLAGVISEPPPTTGLAVMVACALRRVPYAYFAADVWADATGTVAGVPWIVRKAVRCMETLVWRRATTILATSQGVHDRIIELIGPRPSVAVVGNGINIADFTPEGPLAEEPGPYLVYTGTVSEWHGAGIFLDAYERVLAEHPGLRLLFFSEGAHRDELAQRARDRGLDGVEFRRRLPAPEVARYIRGAVAALSSVAPGQNTTSPWPPRCSPPPPAARPSSRAATGTATAWWRRTSWAGRCPTRSRRSPRRACRAVRRGHALAGAPAGVDRAGREPGRRGRPRRHRARPLF